MANDGSTNQIFRIDLDGSNEVTVNASVLTGTDGKARGFCPADNGQSIFFLDKTTRVLRSISYGLSPESFTTRGIKLAGNDWKDIDCTHSFIFYSGIKLVYEAQNNYLYRNELSTGERLEINGTNRFTRGGYGRHVRPPRNERVVGVGGRKLGRGQDHRY